MLSVSSFESGNSRLCVWRSLSDYDEGERVSADVI